MYRRAARKNFSQIGQHRQARKEFFCTSRLISLIYCRRILSLVLIRRIITLVFMLKPPLPTKSMMHNGDSAMKYYRPQDVKLGNINILECRNMDRLHYKQIGFYREISERCLNFSRPDASAAFIRRLFVCAGQVDGVGFYNQAPSAEHISCIARQGV